MNLQRLDSVNSNWLLSSAYDMLLQEGDKLKKKNSSLSKRNKSEIFYLIKHVKLSEAWVNYSSN